MAGSFAEACAIIASVDQGAIGTMATAFRTLGTQTGIAGGKLGGSAETVGAQHGEPYAAYESRLAPVATWLRNLQQPATSTATALDNAQRVAASAQFVMAQQQAALARYGNSMAGRDPATAASAMAAAEAQALAVLNGEIAKMTTAFQAVQPPDPGTAPVHDGARDPGAGSSAASGTTGASATALPAGTGGATGTGTASGPTSGPFAGWVQDPTTGNLIDPATGREVDPSGRFVDPITGQPFGDPSQYASRLEGLQGGVSSALGGGAGSVALGPPLSTPGLTGGGAAAFAPYYGGMIPPSLLGANPAGSQLRQRAAQNMALRAETARRFDAIVAGNGATPEPGHTAAPAAPATTAAHPYLPPMGGAMAPTGAGRRSTRRSGKQMVSEPASVWGATGRGTRGKGRERPTTGAEVVEDADVWTGGVAGVGPGVLGRR